MAEEKKFPTAKEIDDLAQRYRDAQQAVDLARLQEHELREQIIQLVEKHGTVPRRATKSKRLEGDEYKITLSKGHSVEVLTGRVEIFHAWLKRNDLGRLFRRLFKREPVFVLQEQAQEIVNAIFAGHSHPNLANQLPGSIVRALAFSTSTTRADLAALFHHCTAINDNAPTLKVEPKRDDKEPAA